MIPHRNYGDSKIHAAIQADVQPMEELLRKQRKGEFLTREERKRIQKEAEQNRKKNLNKKKK